MNRSPAKSMHVLNFVVHAVVGALLFLAVGLPALILNLITHQMEALGPSGFTLLILTLVEHTILIFDGVAVLVYIGVSTWRELKDMLNE
jgi:membrane-bound ClpP family serine protease